MPQSARGQTRNHPLCPPPPRSPASVIILWRLFPHCGIAPKCTGARQEPSSSTSSSSSYSCNVGLSHSAPGQAGNSPPPSPHPPAPPDIPAMWVCPKVHWGKPGTLLLLLLLRVAQSCTGANPETLLLPRVLLWLFPHRGLAQKCTGTNRELSSSSSSSASATWAATSASSGAFCFLGLCFRYCANFVIGSVFELEQPFCLRTAARLVKPSAVHNPHRAPLALGIAALRMSHCSSDNK